MKAACLQCRVKNAEVEAKLHPSQTSLGMLRYMETPKAIKNNNRCEAHGGAKSRWS